MDSAAASHRTTRLWQIAEVLKQSPIEWRATAADPDPDLYGIPARGILIGAVLAFFLRSGVTDPLDTRVVEFQRDAVLRTVVWPGVGGGGAAAGHRHKCILEAFRLAERRRQPRAQCSPPLAWPVWSCGTRSLPDSLEDESAKAVDHTYTYIHIHIVVIC